MLFFSVEKLNSNNWAVWMFKIEMPFMAKNLFNHLTDDPPNALTNDWTKNDKRARTIINLTLEDSQLIYVKN